MPAEGAQTVNRTSICHACETIVRLSALAQSFKHQVFETIETVVDRSDQLLHRYLWTLTESPVWPAPAATGETTGLFEVARQIHTAYIRTRCYGLEHGEGDPDL